MSDAQLAAELERVAGRAAAAKRALKVLRGQQRLATQLLAALEDELGSLQTRLERTAQEAQHDQADPEEARSTGR